jgi:hypothetical protein
MRLAHPAQAHDVERLLGPQQEHLEAGRLARFDDGPRGEHVVVHCSGGCVLPAALHESLAVGRSGVALEVVQGKDLLHVRAVLLARFACGIVS